MTGRGANRWRAAKAFARRWRRDSGGTAAVEFALLLPVVFLLYLGGFEISQAVATYGKLSDLTTELATVASQDTVYSKAELDLINNASAQVMAPFPTSGLTIMTTEILTDPVIAGQGTVIGSRGLGTSVLPSPHKIGDVLTTLPTNLAVNTTYIMVQSSYNYTLSVGVNFISPIPTMSDQLFFLPRQPTLNTPPTKNNQDFANYQKPPFIGQAFIPCTDCD